MATDISIVFWYKTENEKKNSDSMTAFYQSFKIIANLLFYKWFK